MAHSALPHLDLFRLSALLLSPFPFPPNISSYPAPELCSRALLSCAAQPTTTSNSTPTSTFTTLTTIPCSPYCPYYCHTISTRPSSRSCDLHDALLLSHFSLLLREMDVTTLPRVIVRLFFEPANETDKDSAHLRAPAQSEEGTTSSRSLGLL